MWTIHGRPMNEMQHTPQMAVGAQIDMYVHISINVLSRLESKSYQSIGSDGVISRSLRLSNRIKQPINQQVAIIFANTNCERRVQSAWHIQYNTGPR